MKASLCCGRSPAQPRATHTPSPPNPPQASGRYVEAGAAPLAHCDEEGRMLSHSGLEPCEDPLPALGVYEPERQDLPPYIVASTCPTGLHMH
jgi:hypothetical protein